jgi:hypothetical protein
MSSLTMRLSIENQSAAAVITLHDPLRRIPGVELFERHTGHDLIPRLSVAGSAGCVVANRLSEGPGNGVPLFGASGDTNRLLSTSHSITVS